MANDTEGQAKDDSENYLYFFAYIFQEDWKAIQDIEMYTNGKFTRDGRWNQVKWLWQLVDNHFFAIYPQHGKNEFAVAIGTIRNTELCFLYHTKFMHFDQLGAYIVEALKDVTLFLDPKRYSQKSLKAFGGSVFEKLESLADIVAAHSGLEQQHRAKLVLLQIKPIPATFDKVAAIYRVDYGSTPNHLMAFAVTTTSGDLKLSLYEPISAETALSADSCNRYLKEYYALSSSKLLADWSWPWETKITDLFSQSMALIRRQVLFEIWNEEVHLQKIKTTPLNGVLVHSAAYGFEGRFFTVILDGSNKELVYVGGLQFLENLEVEEGEVQKRLYPLTGSTDFSGGCKAHLHTIFNEIEVSWTEVRASWDAHNFSCTETKAWLNECSIVPIPTQPRSAKYRSFWYLLVCNAPDLPPKQSKVKKFATLMFNKQHSPGNSTNLTMKYFCVLAKIDEGRVEVIKPKKDGVLRLFEDPEDANSLGRNYLREVHENALLCSKRRCD